MQIFHIMKHKKNTSWSHLPNAVSIDKILASLKANYATWASAYDSAYDSAYASAWASVWASARDSARDSARASVWASVWTSAYDSARVSVWASARDSAWLGAFGAICALIAYDDSSKYLNMKIDELKMWSVLSEDPASILILPAVMAFEQIKELELT